MCVFPWVAPGIYQQDPETLVECKRGGKHPAACPRTDYDEVKTFVVAPPSMSPSKLIFSEPLPSATVQMHKHLTVRRKLESVPEASPRARRTPLESGLGHACKRL